MLEVYNDSQLAVICVLLGKDSFCEAEYPNQFEAKALKRAVEEAHGTK